MDGDDDSVSDSASSQGLSDDDFDDLDKYIGPSWSTEDASAPFLENDRPEEATKIPKEFTSIGGARHVSPFVSGLIGQANMCFARGDHEETLRLCNEIIRLEPTLPEPYRTMSEMYEELGEHEKALQLGMIAASNGIKDAASWIALGDKATDLEKTQDAIYCYLKAVKINPKLFEIFLTIIKLYNEEKDRKQIIIMYQRLVKNAPVEVSDRFTEWAQAGAALCHADNDLKSALGIMEEAFRRVPDKVTNHDVNLIVELYIQLSKYKEALEIIATYCDIYIEGEEDLVAEEGSENTSTVFRVNECRLGESPMPLQIRGKLAITLIHLKAFHLTEAIIAPFFESVEEFGDVMLEIAEALMAENRHVDASKVLKVLVNSEGFNAAQVWYLYGECLRILNRKEEAVSAYSVVMELAPQHTEARLIVSELLNDLGRGEEAIDALSQDPNSGFLDIGLLFERCLLLKDKPARTPELLVVGRLLLSRHCARFRNRSEYISFVRYWRIRNKNDLLKKYQACPEEPNYVVGKRMPTADEEFELFLVLCDKAFQTRQFALLQRLTCSAVGSKIICNNNEKESTVLNMAAVAIFLNKDAYGAVNFYKNLIVHGVDTARIWNLFNMLSNEIEDNRWQKYVMRLLAKKPEHFALPIIFANNCFSSGSYKQAVSEYLLLYKHQPSPLIALLIAITFLHIALQKFNTNVSVVVNQAIGYLSQYKELRGQGCEQEVHYNMARLHHQIGLYPHAIYHYKQVLELDAPYELFDLKREAAYNLSRIYIKSKSYDLARKYINKYIVV